MLIGERLDLIRQQLNLSKGQMAESLGLEAGSYSDIIRGKTKSISKSVVKLLEIRHNVNLDYLINERGSMFITHPAMLKNEAQKDESVELKHLKEKIALLEKQIQLYETILNKKK